MKVRRFDRGTMRPPTKMPNGFLKADAYLTRVGVFLYRTPDGKERREFRPPEEVFRDDSLESLRLVPLTLEHPTEGDGMLTAENAKEHTVGSVGHGHPDYEGHYVQGPVMVTDKAAVKAVESGKQELSCGYLCSMDEVPGEWMGQQYDAVQRNITYNHVAVVGTGRAGKEVRIKMDAADAIQIEAAPPKENTVKVKLDNKEHDITESAAADLERERAATQAKLDSVEAKAKKAESELAQAQAKLDAAEAEKKKTARAAFEAEVKAFLPADAKLDGLSETEVKAKVIQALQPEAKLDGKSADYVSAYFDIVVAEKKDKAAPVTQSKVLSEARADTAPTDEKLPRADAESPEEARKKMMERNANAWQKKPN